MRCYLVRHAQTAWNAANRLQGHADMPLSPAGRHQARRLGAYFASHHLSALFTSGLSRSRATAEAIVAGNGHGLTAVVDPDLAEVGLGTWEGLSPAEIDARFTGAYQRWVEAPSSVRIPHGEPLAAFRRRVRRAFARLVASRAGEEDACVIVTHGGVIAALLADLLEADYDAVLRRTRLDNGGITALEVWPDTPPVVLWVNATGHLVAK